ncbi:MAG: biotin/lipoyl-binding protein, partial [Pseudomonadota bacterium]
MPLFISNFSFSRQGLPILALIGIVAAVIFIFANLPDRAIAGPDQQPPRATGELANSARVAGVGLVEPASEVIDIGSALSGLVTDLRVETGDMVEKGQPLFLVDARAARARLQEANAAIAEARAGIAEARTARNTANQQLALFRNLDDPA